MEYRINFKPRDTHTADPSKYPQGYFKDKGCRWCGDIFKPTAPSAHYCGDICSQQGALNNYLKRVYKIDLDYYNNLYMKQEGKCAICKSEGFVMKSCHTLKLVVDHCHSEGHVRGLLCHNCNRGLGLFGDSKETLKIAMEYLTH